MSELFETLLSLMKQKRQEWHWERVETLISSGSLCFNSSFSVSTPPVSAVCRPLFFEIPIKLRTPSFTYLRIPGVWSKFHGFYTHWPLDRAFYNLGRICILPCYQRWSLTRWSTRDGLFPGFHSLWLENEKKISRSAVWGNKYFVLSAELIS